MNTLTYENHDRIPLKCESEVSVRGFCPIFDECEVKNSGAKILPIINIVFQLFTFFMQFLIN